MKVQIKHDVISEKVTESDVAKIIAVVSQVHFHYKDGTVKKATNAESLCLGMTVENGEVKFNRKLKFI